MRVGLGDLVKQYHGMQEQIDGAIRGVLESGRFILGRSVEEFEQEIAASSGAAFAVGVNSGTDALLLALVAEGIGPGDEVITTPFTFVATAETISLLQAKPVFADIDPRTFNLSPAAAETAITPRTKAILPVDLYGQMADRDAFCDIAKRHGLKLIWDAAQAIGASFGGRPLAAFPGCATLSFYPTKNLGAFGDGGMVLTNDEEVRDRLLLYRFHGSGGGYYYREVGYCSRLDALQAAVLSAKLQRLSAWNEARRRNACRYRERLAGLGLELPWCDPRAQHVYHQFTVRHRRRDALKGWLADRGVDSSVYYPRALHLQDAYRSLGYGPGSFPEAERATDEVLSIPIHPELDDAQLDYVAEQIQEFTRTTDNEATRQP